MDIVIPYLARSATGTITIDGVVYQVPLLDSSGRIIVVGIGSGGAIEAIQDTPADLKTAVHGLDGATQRQIVVDSSGRIMINPMGIIISGGGYQANAVAGTNYLTSSNVPTGKIWRITHCAVRDINSAPSRVEIYYRHNDLPFDLLNNVTPSANLAVIWNGEIFADAGDYVQIAVYGCTLNDDIQWSFTGEEFTI